MARSSLNRYFLNYNGHILVYKDTRCIKVANEWKEIKRKERKQEQPWKSFTSAIIQKKDIYYWNNLVCCELVKQPSLLWSIKQQILLWAYKTVRFVVIQENNKFGYELVK